MTSLARMSLPSGCPISRDWCLPGTHWFELASHPFRRFFYSITRPQGHGGRPRNSSRGWRPGVGGDVNRCGGVGVALVPNC